MQDIFQATYNLKYIFVLKVENSINPVHHRLRDFVGIYMHKALLGCLQARWEEHLRSMLTIKESFISWSPSISHICGRKDLGREMLVPQFPYFQTSLPRREN